MMGIEINIPEDGENGLSVIVDPFLSDSLESLSINYRKNSFSKDTYWYANVVFQNGRTKGEQRLGNCETFEDIVIQVKHLLNEIKNKSNG
jgi:hypothetical protein